MGPVAIPILMTAWGVGAVGVASSAISAASTTNNYVTRRLDSVDRSDRVIQIRVRSCWIGHGFGAAIGSAFSGITTGNSVTHWWVEIQTQKGWYCAQLNSGGLYLHRHSSREQVNECGLRQGSNDSQGNITTKMTHRPSNRTMGDVYDYVEASNNRYDLVNHNCQDWAKEFYNWI